MINREHFQLQRFELANRGVNSKHCVPRNSFNPDPGTSNAKNVHECENRDFLKMWLFTPGYNILVELEDQLLFLIALFINIWNAVLINTAAY